MDDFSGGNEDDGDAAAEVASDCLKEERWGTRSGGRRDGYVGSRDGSVIEEGRTIMEEGRTVLVET